MSAVVQTTFLPTLVFLRICIRLTRPWPLTFKVTAHVDENESLFSIINNLENMYVFVQHVSVFLSLYTNIYTRIRQMSPTAVSLALKLKLFWRVILLPWPLTVRPLNGLGFLPANFQLPMPFHSRLMVRHSTEQTDRRTDNGHQCIMPPSYEVGHNKPAHPFNSSQYIVNKKTVCYNKILSTCSSAYQTGWMTINV